MTPEPNRPTSVEAYDWSLKNRQLEREVKFLHGLLRANLREAWSAYRCVDPGRSHPSPWKFEDEPDFRGMLQKMVTAAELEIRDDGRVGSISYPQKLRELFLKAHTLLKDTE